MTLGERIKVARDRLGMSLEAVGDELGVTKQAVNGWEQGGQPEANRLPLLRKTLRVTFSWLMGGEGPPPATSDPAVIFEDMQADLYEKMRALAEPPRKA